MILRFAMNDSCSACFYEAQASNAAQHAQVGRNCPPPKCQDPVGTLYLLETFTYSQASILSQTQPRHLSVTSLAKIMSQPAYSPTLLGIPPELRFKIYEHLYGGEVLTLKPGSPLHPDLSLLRVCKTIYAEARVTVIKNVKLRILARSSILILPHEIKQAWLCYAQDVTISHGSLLFALREVNFLSSAKWLQTLRVGYNFTTDEHDSYEAYRAATNDIRDYNDGLSPITSKDKVWDDYLLNGVIERSSPTSTIPIYGWSQCRLEMLQNLILNKGRGFKLTGLLRATLGHYQTVGTKPVSTELVSSSHSQMVLRILIKRSNAAPYIRFRHFRDRGAEGLAHNGRYQRSRRT